MKGKFISILKSIGYLLLSVVVQFIVAIAVAIFIVVKEWNKVASLVNQASAVEFLTTEFMKSLSVIMAVYSVLTVLIILLIFKLRKKNAMIEFGLNRFNAKSNFWAILIGIAAWLVNSIALAFMYMSGTLQNEFNKFAEYSNGMMSSSVIINVLIIGIVVPFAEEFIFRGAILRTLKKSMKVKYAIAIQAILFGIAHGNLIQFIYTVFIGCILGYVAYKCKSIWPSVAIHMTNNLLAVVATTPMDKMIQNVYVAVVILVVGIIGLFFGIKAINKLYLEEKDVELVYHRN